MPAPSIPLTVVGGYLGAGKTTLLNHLLRNPGGRRIGVIVNDFGSLAIDAGLLAESGGGDIVSLPNGCVCCTVGAGLHEALSSLVTSDLPPDHIVIEVSGVADPAAAAAWGTVAPFESAGVIVLADATSVIERSRDRYVGSEVTRQLGGADLVVVTKSDVCDEPRLDAVEAWLATTSGGAPSIRVVDGRVPPEVVLGIRSERTAESPGHEPHDDRYVSWAWASTTPVSREVLERFLDALPVDVLRVKGRLRLDDDTWVLVQVVGRRIDVSVTEAAVRSELVAIALRSDPPAPSPFASHFG